MFRTSNCSSSVGLHKKQCFTMHIMRSLVADTIRMSIIRIVCILLVVLTYVYRDARFRERKKIGMCRHFSDHENLRAVLCGRADRKKGLTVAFCSCFANTPNNRCTSHQTAYRHPQIYGVTQRTN
jgi:hypothetical protein